MSAVDPAIAEAVEAVLADTTPASKALRRKVTAALAPLIADAVEAAEYAGRAKGLTNLSIDLGFMAPPGNRLDWVDVHRWLERQIRDRLADGDAARAKVARLRAAVEDHVRDLYGNCRCGWRYDGEAADMLGQYLDHIRAALAATEDQP